MNLVFFCDQDLSACMHVYSFERSLLTGPLQTEQASRLSQRTRLPTPTQPIRRPEIHRAHSPSRARAPRHGLESTMGQPGHDGPHRRPGPNRKRRPAQLPLRRV